MGQRPTAFVPSGPPQGLVLCLRDALGIHHFIEGGTFRARTAKWAAQHFEHVITIEASATLFDQLRHEHSAHPNIEFLQGDTRVVLPSILEQLRTPAILWLDSHWSDGETFGQGDECPLLRELEVINASPLDHVILIDDARLFTFPPPPPHDVDGWPELREICKSLCESQRDRYVVIVDDVVVAVPRSHRADVIQWSRDVSK